MIVIAATALPRGLALRYPSTFHSRGIRMFGEERSYFRYVVVGLVGLMMVGFWMLSKPA